MLELVCAERKIVIGKTWFIKRFVTYSKYTWEKDNKKNLEDYALTRKLYVKKMCRGGGNI